MSVALKQQTQSPQVELTFPFTAAPQATHSLAIDLVDACNLRCPTCVRGLRYMKNHKRQMEYGLFMAIIDKATFLGLRYASLYNWTEPFLCRELPRYAAYVRQQGLFCQLSSNLSFPYLPHIIPSLKFCDRLFVSLSGFSQSVYQINHRGGNVAFVKRNLELIATAKARGEIATDVCIRYFMFDHSKAEYPLFEEFALSLGLRILRWQGYGNPRLAHPAITRNNETAWLENCAHFQDLPRTLERTGAGAGMVCPVAIAPVNVDWRGDVSLCCMKPAIKSTRIGSFLEDDFDVIQYRRATHPLCATCQNPWSRVAPMSYHKMSLLRGLMKSLGADAYLLREAAAEAVVAEQLAGREVYFWGCGEMFRRKRHVFSSCKPRCILADYVGRPETCDGLPVRHPDEVLEREPLPIVIFAGRQSRETILCMLEARYPQITEIFFCSDQ